MANVITIPNINQYEQQVVEGTLILTKKIHVILDKALIVKDKAKIYEDAYNNLMFLEKINLSRRPEYSLEDMSKLITSKLDNIKKYLPKHNLYEKKPFVDWMFDTYMKAYTEHQNASEYMKTYSTQYKSDELRMIHLGNLFKHPREHYYYTNDTTSPGIQQAGLPLPELYYPRSSETENYKSWQINFIEELYDAIYAVTKLSGGQKHFFTKKYEPPRYHHAPTFLGMEYSYCQQDIAEIIQLAENTLLLIPAFLLK
jgi:hypothetical protein